MQHLLRLGAAAFLAGWSLSAAAQPALPSSPAAPQAGEHGPASAPVEAATGVWERSNLLGDLGGLRSALADRGVTVSLTETSEALGNFTGGVHRGAAYDGVLLMGFALDTSRAFRWEGGTFNVTAFQIHGRNLSADNLLTLQTASGIEANRATRVWEAWYQQVFLDGRLDVKLGQQSLDQEFLTSQGSGLFINTAMGWPVLPSFDQYAGGPAYPLSSLGVRLRAQPTGNITVLGGVFDDNPPGGAFYNDSQTRGAEQSGAQFNTGTGALFIAEVQYALNPPTTPAPGQPVSAPPAPGLPGVYKLGAWFDTGSFPDQRFDTAGLSLANPASTANARERRHNFSVYGVADQTVWRPDPEGARAVGVFARLMGSPSDRNLIDVSLNTGVTLKAPIAGRDNDTIGLGYGYAHVSGRAADLNRDTVFYSGQYVPIRSSETFLELTYQTQIAPWWLVQPDAQYVFMPGAGVLNPLSPTTRIKNELVLGLRTNVTF